MTRKYDLPSPHKQYVQGQCSDGKGGTRGGTPRYNWVSFADPCTPLASQGSLPLTSSQASPCMLSRGRAFWHALVLGVVKGAALFQLKPKADNAV